MSRQSPGAPEQTLRTAGVGVPLLVTGSPRTTAGARHRLAELGVREGAHVLIRGRTAGGGVILAVGDGRIALSRRLLASIPVEPDPAPAAPAATRRPTRAADPGRADS